MGRIMTSEILNGPSWQVIAIAAIIFAGSLLTIIVGLVANYAKTLGQRVTSVERDQSKLEKLILKDYHNKDEIRQLLADLKTSIDAVHQRMDKIGFPHLHSEK